MDENRPVAENLGTNGPLARDRIVRLFKYVAAYHQMRNQAVRQLSAYEWRLPFADFPDHRCIELLRRVEAEEPAEDTEPFDQSPAERILLRCTRPTTTEPPPAPIELEGWLGRDWDDCQTQPEPIPWQNKEDR